MAMWLFTSAILAGNPINVYNHGRMKRNFTYIDDIVSGVLSVADSPTKAFNGSNPHRVYNIGNHRPEDLLHMIGLIEKELGRTAEKKMLPIQAGDVPESFADIDALRKDYGFEPTPSRDKGIPLFVDWYKSYHAKGGRA
jgi:UDP-glucuronate 4-epimerase